MISVARTPSAEQGFTLLEILVVLTLMSIVMLGLGSALRSMAQTEVRIDQRLERADEFRVTNTFLRSVLGRVSARKVPGQVPAGASPFQFVAHHDSVTWVGVMPARFGAGGRYFFRLALEANAIGNDLVVRFQPWQADVDMPDWGSADSHVLARRVTGFALRYEDARAQPAAWNADWTVLDHLPARVNLRIEQDGFVWPDLVVPLRVLPQSDSSLGGFVIGGGRS